MKRAAPIRSCVVCRQRFPQGALLRIRRAGEGLTTAPEATGRSVYVCRHPACRAGVCERGRIERGLRCRLTPEVLQAFRRGLEPG